MSDVITCHLYIRDGVQRKQEGETEQYDEQAAPADKVTFPSLVVSFLRNFVVESRCRWRVESGISEKILKALVVGLELF